MLRPHTQTVPDLEKYPNAKTLEQTKQQVGSLLKERKALHAKLQQTAAAFEAPLREEIERLEEALAEARQLATRRFQAINKLEAAVEDAKDEIGRVKNSLEAANFLNIEHAYRIEQQDEIIITVEAQLKEKEAELKALEEQHNTAVREFAKALELQGDRVDALIADAHKKQLEIDLLDKIARKQQTELTENNVKFANQYAEILRNYSEINVLDKVARQQQEELTANMGQQQEIYRVARGALDYTQMLELRLHHKKLDENAAQAETRSAERRLKEETLEKQAAQALARSAERRLREKTQESDQKNVSLETKAAQALARSANRIAKETELTTYQLLSQKLATPEPLGGAWEKEDKVLTPAEEVALGQQLATLLQPEVKAEAPVAAPEVKATTSDAAKPAETPAPVTAQPEVKATTPVTPKTAANEVGYLSGAAYYLTAGFYNPWAPAQPTPVAATNPAPQAPAAPLSPRKP